jgi:hypothetical protein
MNDQEKLFDKIRKLLRQAENTPHEEEARTFYAKAQELMLRFRIEESLLWVNDPSKRESIDTIDIGIKDKQPGARYKRLILLRIAQLSSCRMYYIHAGNQSKVVGFPQDLVWTDMLYSSIMSQASFAMAKAQAIDGDGINTRTFRNNFYRGFANRIIERLDETYKQAVESVAYSGSTALVLASRAAQVDQYVDKNLNLGRASRPGAFQYNEKAMTHGRLAADVTDINVTKTVSKAPPKGELSG